MGVMKKVVPECRIARPSAAILALALIVPAAARASLALAMNLGEMTSRADRVIVGEVLSVKSAWDAGHKRIFTNIEVQVAETWKGATTPDGKVVIQQPGGRVGDIESRVHGLAEFHAGDRAVLFLRGTEQASAVVGLGQGARALRFDPTAQRWLVNGGDRSAAVKTDPRGHYLAPDPEPALPLDTLRMQIQRLVTP
jgi:hypothetical protein